MTVTIMIIITICWLLVGYWGMALAANPDFNKPNIPALLAIFVFPFIILGTAAILGIV